MWKIVLLCLLIFVVTAAETLVATWEGRADRQSTSAKHNRFSRKAAFWATVFEAILFLDIILVAREGWFLLGPILLGAYVSKYWALEHRRKKFRARVKRPRRKREREEHRDQPVAALDSGGAPGGRGDPLPAADELGEGR